MLTKRVLCAADEGAYELVEVPFSWQRGDPLPGDAVRYAFQSAAEALADLVNRGREQSGLNLQQSDIPEPVEAVTPSDKPRPPKPTDRELYAEFIQRATRWRDLPSQP